MTRKQFYEQQLRDLLGTTSLSDLAIGYKVLDPSEKSHADDDFLGDAWWPNEAEKAEILRQTFIKAYRVAIDADKPIVVFWVVAGGTFEGVVVEGDFQVSLFILTPKPPSASLTGNVDEKMWLVATPGRVAQVRNLYADPSAIDVEPVASGKVEILHYKAD